MCSYIIDYRAGTLIYNSFNSKRKLWDEAGHGNRPDLLKFSAAMDAIIHVNLKLSNKTMILNTVQSLTLSNYQLILCNCMSHPTLNLTYNKKITICNVKIYIIDLIM